MHRSSVQPCIHCIGCTYGNMPGVFVSLRQRYQLKLIQESQNWIRCCCWNFEEYKPLSSLPSTSYLSIQATRLARTPIAGAICPWPPPGHHHRVGIQQYSFIDTSYTSVGSPHCEDVYSNALPFSFIYFFRCYSTEVPFKQLFSILSYPLLTTPFPSKSQHVQLYISCLSTSLTTLRHQLRVNALPDKGAFFSN